MKRDLASWGHYTATSVGQVAHKTLSTCKEATVLGASSRGLFLATSAGEIVYVSFESYRGPLTLTLATCDSRIRGLEAKAQVLLTCVELVFPRAELRISVPVGSVWHQPPPERRAMPLPERLRTLKEAAEAVRQQMPASGMGLLLNPLLGLPGQNELSAVQRQALDAMRRCQRELERGREAEAATTLASILGLGDGLTPSGDDLVVGMLLAINRWTDELWRYGDRAVFNSHLTGAARLATTALGWNMVACAAEGLASERLVHVLDSLMAGFPALEESLPALLAWGASSGYDSLVGIALAMTAHSLS